MREAMHSTGTWAAAVDPDVSAETSVAATPPAPAFTAGVFAGILVAAIVAQFWLAQHLSALAFFVLDGVPLRSLSRLAVSPLWRFGVPVGFTAVLFVLLGLRVRATAVWAVVAGAAIATLVLTHIWAFAALD
jgi:hypothetical protein